jgi:hypothetical protein
LVKSRITVDWDGDGFKNKGAILGSPPNLYTGAPYMGKAKLTTQQFTTGDPLSEDIYEVHDYGLAYRRLEVGGASDKGETVRLGWDGREEWQPLPGDQANLIEGAAQMYLTGIKYGIRDFDTGNNPWGTDQFVRRVAIDDLRPPVVSVYANLKNTVGSHLFQCQYDQSGTKSVYTFGYYCGTGSSAGLTTTGRFAASYFADSPTNNYIDSRGAAVTWGGFTVLPNTTDTFIFRAWAVTGTPALSAYVYAPSATLTTPNFGRNMLARVNSTTNNAWTTHAITFTTGASDTQVALAVYINTNAITPLYSVSAISGLMLFTGTVAAPTRFWDNSIVHTPDKFAFTAEANKSYTISFWARTVGPGDTAELAGSLTNYEIYTNNSTVEATANLTGITNDWKRFDFTLPSQTYERGFSLDWDTIEVNGVPTDATTGVVLDFTGFMVVEGATALPYRAGALYDYDDISTWALRTSTKSGRGSAEEVMAYEGVATIELDNSERLFSPENEDSPLYDIFNQNRSITIEVEIDGVWVTVWTGWTYAFDVTPGANHDNRATLTCNQGFFRMRESSFTAPVARNTTIDPLVQEIIEAGGWRAPNSPYASNLGYNTRLDENAFLSDPDMLFGQTDTGVNNLELVGQDWGRKTPPEAAIKSLLESENATLFIARDGRLVLQNREHWLDTTEAVTLDIDTEVQEAEYSFGQGIINHAEVSLSLKKEIMAASVWETKRAFKVKPSKLPTDLVVIEIHAEHIEGRQKTITTYSLDNMVKTVYKEDPGTTYSNPQLVLAKEADLVKVQLVPVGAGLYRLKIRNENSFYVWIDIELKGDYMDTGDGTTIIYEDEEAIANVEALHSSSYSNTVINTEQQARAMGAFHVLRNSTARGEFSSIEVRDDLEKIRDLVIGTKIVIHETQTDQESKPHIILAEDLLIEKAFIVATYTLARGFEDEYVIISEDLADPADEYLVSPDAAGLYALRYAENMVDDQKRLGLVGGASVSFSDSDNTFTYNSGYEPNVLYLDSPVGQIEVYPTGYAATPEFVGFSSPALSDFSNNYVPDSFGQTPYTNGGGGNYFMFKDLNTQVGLLPIKASTKYRFIGRALGLVGTPDYMLEAYTAAGQLKDWGGVSNATRVRTLGADGANHYVLDVLAPANPPLAMYVYGSFMKSADITRVQYSKLRATLATTTCHYHLYAQRNPRYPAVSHTLTVYDAYTGLVVGSQSQVVGDTPVHFDVTPVGLSSVNSPEGVPIYNVFATFGKTVEDYTQHEVVIQGYGYVPTIYTVSSADDLHKDPVSYKLFP